MVFKRRTPLTYYEAVSHSLYPKGGWRRAAQYVIHRVRRLPDPAHKISRGIACGVFACFTPFFGLHFVLASGLAWALGGNIMAALLATFFGNPLTFPIIAAVSVELGGWMLGYPPIPLPFVVTSFSEAALELWQNVIAVFTPAETQWHRLDLFWTAIFLPYLVGGIIPGIATAMAAYFLANPILAAYQRARVSRLKKRFAKKREKVVSRRIEAEEAEAAAAAAAAAVAEKRPAAE